MFEVNKNCIHKFKHLDADSDIEIIDEKVELTEEIPIEDNINQPPHPPNEGYVSLPSKLSFNLFIGWMVHLLVLTGGGVSMYMSIKSEQAILTEKVTRIEESMYTASEAKLRKEMIDRDIDSLKEEIKEEIKGKGEK